MINNDHDGDDHVYLQTHNDDESRIQNDDHHDSDVIVPNMHHNDGCDDENADGNVFDPCCLKKYRNIELSFNEWTLSKASSLLYRIVKRRTTRCYLRVFLLSPSFFLDRERKNLIYDTTYPVSQASAIWVLTAIKPRGNNVLLGDEVRECEGVSMNAMQ